MECLLNTDVCGFKMTGLLLCDRRVFIGLSQNVREGANPESSRQKTEAVYRKKENDWMMTGVVGRGNAWFLGMSVVSPEKTLRMSPNEGAAKLLA